MAVIARFISRTQADGALRALRASGFDASLLDYPAGGDAKVRRLDDFRLTVPEQQGDDALALLSELYPDAPVDEGGGGSTPELDAAAVVLTPARGSDAPWLTLRTRSSALSEWFGVATIPFIVLAVLFVAGVVVRAIYNLLTYGQLF